jgi:hypothetical protein
MNTLLVYNFTIFQINKVGALAVMVMELQQTMVIGGRKEEVVGEQKMYKTKP